MTSIDWLHDLYRFTHIVPTNADFFTQINNMNPVYLVLYWNRLEALYPRFMEEEMDLEAISLMNAEDYAFFGIQPHLFHPNRTDPTIRINPDINTDGNYTNQITQIYLNIPTLRTPMEF